MGPAPSVSSSITARLHVEARPTVVSELTTAIEHQGGLVTGIDVTESGSARMTVDVTCATSGEAHAQRIVEALRHVAGVEVDRVSARTFLLHLGGKLRIAPTTPIRNRDDLFKAVADAQNEIITAGFELDYLEARHAETLAPVASLADGPIRLILAARIGSTRLLDNTPV